MVLTFMQISAILGLDKCSNAILIFCFFVHTCQRHLLCCCEGMTYQVRCGFVRTDHAGRIRQCGMI